MALRVAEHSQRTDTGRSRTANEDSYFARSPLFAVADGMGGAQAGEVASAKDDAGVEHSLAVAPDPGLAAAVARFLATRPVVIADGHHRYETALAYRDERRAAAGGSDAGPAERTLAYFANAYAPGTLLLPIHRVVRAVPAPGDADWHARLPGWEERRIAVSSAETAS